MKERPIIFTSESIRTILAGEKTQTRRVIKPQPCAIIDDWPYMDNPTKVVDESTGKVITVFSDKNMNRLVKPIRCPYGEVGDHLWVKETWFPDPPQDDTWDYYVYTDGLYTNLNAIPKRFRNPENSIYKASWKGMDLRWRPSRYMPRWASRITLEIINIRFERVQNISEEDAKAEGVIPTSGMLYPWHYSFFTLWDSINAKRGYPYSSNPWVWVVEYKAIS